VPEGRGIFPSLGVEETLRLAAAMAAVPKTEVASRLEEAYGTFPRLAERRSQTAGTLSGGEQQMLALGRGLIARPRLLMVDEMSQGLAPTIVAELFATLATFRARGVSILLVEQFVGQALDIADRAYVLEKGDVVYSGAAGDLAGDEEFVRSSYLGTIDLDAADREIDREAIVVGEQVPVALPPTLLRGVQRRADELGITSEELLRQLAEEALAEKKRRVGSRAKAGDGGVRRAR
jgi:ABC-type multidrug transport system ATPase subunit